MTRALLTVWFALTAALGPAACGCAAVLATPRGAAPVGRGLPCCKTRAGGPCDQRDDARGHRQPTPCRKGCDADRVFTPASAPVAGQEQAADPSDEGSVAALPGIAVAAAWTTAAGRPATPFVSTADLPFVFHRLRC